MNQWVKNLVYLWNKEKTIAFAGTTGVGTAYFHYVTLEIGGWSHECFAGFTPDLDKVGIPCGILGHEGFFDRYEVAFNFKKELIEVKKNI
jgi:hypothetical protein